MRLPIVAAFFTLISLVVAVASAQPGRAPAPAASAGAPSAAPPAPSASSAPASPDAAKKDDARKHFEEGLAHFDRSEWSAALAEFLTSRSLFATRAATKDAAICLRKEGRFDEALDMWEALEKEFSDLAPEDKTLADREIADLRRSVGFVTIRGGEPGANVVVDGRTRGTLPVTVPIRVSAGSHVVRVYKEGFVAFETRVDVAGQATVAVDAHLDALTQSGRLRVSEAESKPVSVFVDNVEVGKAPWEGTIAVGDHVVVLKGEGTLGTQPVDAPIRLNQLTPLTLVAENLDASARVDPTPGGATVAIDGVVVGRGVWEGRLRVGGHKIEVAQDGFIAFSTQISLGKDERKIVTAQLDRDPTSPLWGESAKSKFVVEIDGAFMMAPVFGGDVVASCTGACSPPLPIGALGQLHVAYQLATGLGFGLEGGYMALSDSLSGRPATVVGTRLLAPEGPGTANDKLSLSGLLIGASGSFHRGDTWPLTVRVGVGAFIASARDVRTGSFTTSSATTPPNTPYTTDDTETHGATYLYAAPEVRFGRRFGDHLEINVGVQLWILSALSRPSWEDVNQVLAGPITAPPQSQAGKPYNDGLGGFGSQTLTGGFLFAIAPGLGLRYEF